MKFYRGVIDVGKSPVRHEVQRGFRPMTTNRDNQAVFVPDSAPINPMSAAEVVILRSLYGEDAVRELAEIDEKKNLSFTAERDRLETLYGDKVVARLFGPRGVRAALPREIEIGEAYRSRDDVMVAAEGEAESAAA